MDLYIRLTQWHANRIIRGREQRSCHLSLPKYYAQDAAHPYAKLQQYEATLIDMCTIKRHCFVLTVRVHPYFFASPRYSP